MWKIYFLAALIFVGIIGYIFIDFNNFIINGVTIVGWLLFFFQTVYNATPQFKISLDRLKIYISNPTINWSFLLVHKFNELGDQVSNDVFGVVEDYLMTQNDFKIEKRNNNSSLYTIRGYLIRLTIREDENTIQLEIGDKDISYRESLKIISQISNHLERLNIFLKSDEQEYYVSMQIANINPFRGILINNIDNLNIESFRVKLSNKYGKIDVYNDCIELYSSSISNIIMLSKKYLHISEKK